MIKITKHPNYKIRQLRKIPIPNRKGNSKIISRKEKDDEDSSEESSSRRDIIKIPIDIVQQQNATRNKPIGKKLNKISSFILKENSFDKYTTVPARKSLNPSKSQSPFRPINPNKERYEIKIPFKKEEDNSKDNIKTIINHYYCNVINNNNISIPIINQQEIITKDMTSNIIKIQSMYRGYFIRQNLTSKLRLYCRFHIGIDKVNKVYNKIVKKNKQLLMNGIKNIYVKENSFKRITNKVILVKKNSITGSTLKFTRGMKLDVTHFKGIYNKNVIPSNLRVYKKELTESFEIDKTKKEKQFTKKEIEKEVNFAMITYKEQIKEKVLINLIKIINSQLNNQKHFFFRQCIIGDIVKNNTKRTIESLKNKQLKKVISHVENGKNNVIKRQGFFQFMICGLKYQMKIYQNERDEAIERFRLHKLIQEREKENKKQLKIYFNKMYHNTLSSKLREALKKNKIEKEEELKMKKDKKLYKLLLNKQSKQIKFKQSQFSKLYYRGVFRQMMMNQVRDIVPEIENDPQIQTIIRNSLTKKASKAISSEIEIKPEEKPKEEIVEEKKEIANPTNTLQEKRKKARELRKLIANKGKMSKATLKIYFMKFYLAGVKAKMLRRNKYSMMNTKSHHVSLSFSNEALEQDDKHGYRVMGAKKLTEEEEKAIKEKEEQEKRKQEIEEKFLKVFALKERGLLVITKEKFDTWNVRAKLFRIKSMSDIRKKKKGKKKVKKSLNENKSMDLLPIKKRDTLLNGSDKDKSDDSTIIGDK